MIDDFLPHVTGYMRELRFAVAFVHPISYLSVEIDDSACAAIAVDQEATKTTSARTGSPAVLVIHTEEQPGEMQTVNKKHQVHENSDLFCVKIIVPRRVFT